MPQEPIHYHLNGIRGCCSQVAKQQVEEECSVLSPLPMRQANAPVPVANRISGAKRIPPTPVVTGTRRMY